MLTLLCACSSGLRRLSVCLERLKLNTGSVRQCLQTTIILCMRKAFVNMAMRLGTRCEFTAGQAKPLHGNATDTLLRSGGIHAQTRAKSGQDFKLPGIRPANHRALSASVSTRQTQTRAYSAQYGYDQEPKSGEFTTIPWDPMAANAVSLIGNTGMDVEVKRLQTGNIMGNVSLACTHKAGETTWYDIRIWGPMAERIAAQVPKGSYVCIQGKLTPSTWVNQDGIKQTRFQITANNVRFVEKYAAPLMGGQSAQQGGWGQAKDQQPQSWGASAVGQEQPSSQGSEWGTANSSFPVQQPQAPAGTLTRESSAEEKWKSVLDTPNLWWNNTANKRNPRAPDFKLKSDPTGACALWIGSRDTPEWAKEQLEKSGVIPYQASGFTDMN